MRKFCPFWFKIKCEKLILLEENFIYKKSYIIFKFIIIIHENFISFKYYYADASQTHNSHQY